MTGVSSVGKTTVLAKTVAVLKEWGMSIGGMISREVRQKGVRVGFEILDLTSGKYGLLANIDQKSGPRVGKYRVNVEDLENIGAQAILDATEKSVVVAIDEIGPMELFSQKFKQAVKQALDGKKPVLAVVHAKADDPLIREAKLREDAEIFEVTLDNREGLVESINKEVLDTI